jgi:hypothetical protein
MPCPYDTLSMTVKSSPSPYTGRVGEGHRALQEGGGVLLKCWVCRWNWVG